MAISTPEYVQALRHRLHCNRSYTGAGLVWETLKIISRVQTFKSSTGGKKQNEQLQKKLPFKLTEDVH